MTITPSSSGAGSVVILNGCGAIWHIPIRTVGNSTTSAPIAMLNMPTACRVSVVPRAIRRPPATMIGAPIPVPARAAHPQVMGKSVPGRSLGKAPAFHRQGRLSMVSGLQQYREEPGGRRHLSPFYQNSLLPVCSKLSYLTVPLVIIAIVQPAKKEKTMVNRLNRSRIVLLNRFCSVLNFFRGIFHIL